MSQRRARSRLPRPVIGVLWFLVLAGAVATAGLAVSAIAAGLAP